MLWESVRSNLGSYNGPTLWPPSVVPSIVEDFLNKTYSRPPSVVNIRGLRRLRRHIRRRLNLGSEDFEGCTNTGSCFYQSVMLYGESCRDGFIAEKGGNKANGGLNCVTD